MELMVKLKWPGQRLSQVGSVPFQAMYGSGEAGMYPSICYLHILAYAAWGKILEAMPRSSSQDTARDALRHGAAAIRQWVCDQNIDDFKDSEFWG